jgi:phosphatidyl-myo-inositol dimannoside synthase
MVKHSKTIIPLRKDNRILFICLYAFDMTGGIEKFNRVFMRALDESSNHLQVLCLYDRAIDRRYISESNITVCGGNKLRFLALCLIKNFSINKLIIAHINLLPIAAILKLFNYKLKVIINIHGIEVWKRFSFFRRNFLKHFNFISVSNYTFKTFAACNNISADNCYILPNCLDPELQFGNITTKPSYLLKRYKISPDAKVLLAVTRLARTERKKNYLRVIELMPELIQRQGETYFILGGKYEPYEYDCIVEKARSAGVYDHLILPGFISDEELFDHYQLADAYVLPSEKEGFGITFIEAMASGLQVVTGDSDGSVETIFCENAGSAVNLNNPNYLILAIEKALDNPLSLDEKRTLAQGTRRQFSYCAYKQRLQALINA